MANSHALIGFWLSSLSVINVTSFAAACSPASQRLPMQLPAMLQGGKARELAAFLQSVTQEGAAVLPDAAQKAAAFHAVVHSLVYDVLMSKVSSRRICPIHAICCSYQQTQSSRCRKEAGRTD